MSDRIRRQAPLLADLSWGKGEFRTLYIRHQASLYQFALRSLDDPTAAKELVFEVMCEAWSKGVKGLHYRSLRSTRTHLLRIAYKKSCERCAERVVVNPHTYAPERLRHESASDQSDPSLDVEAAKDPERVRTCVARLSQVERQVLQLTLCESMGTQMIAYIIDCTLDQVRKTMAVAEHNLMQGLSLPAEAGTGKQIHPQISAQDSSCD